MKPLATAGLLVAAIGVLVAVPVAARRNTPAAVASAPHVVVMTPHNEQIRTEFAEGFSAWYQAKYGEPATVIWSSPGGTSEIRKMLVASYTAALRDDVQPGGDADVLFGGGSYEFTALAQPIAMTVGGVKRTTTVLEPFKIPEAELNAIYEESELGGRRLYAADGSWYGAALSSFGIVYNNEVLKRLGVPVPAGWESLADPRLQGWTALVNPSQSGSVATAFETILLREGWNNGWRILRRAAANARSISASAPRAPIEVSQGEAAEGLAIDFYGRFQQQAVARGGSPDRVGYMDPVGRTAVDPDPIAILRGAPNREVAERFIQFVLSADGQRLWQLPAGTPGGPRQFELRRLPVNRQIYASDGDRFMDKVDPRTLAHKGESSKYSVRDFVSPIFVAMAIDSRQLLRQAWACIARHPEYPHDGTILSAEDARDPRLKAMLTAFDALPTVPGPEGAVYDLNDPKNLAAVQAGWLKGGWMSAKLWHADDAPAEVLRREWGRFFRAQCEEVIRLSDQAP